MHVCRGTLGQGDADSSFHYYASRLLLEEMQRVTHSTAYLTAESVEKTCMHKQRTDLLVKKRPTQKLEMQRRRTHL
jgi:hypothetical protein